MSETAGKRLRIAHLTTVDMSLALLLETELRVDLQAGNEVFGLSAPGRYVSQVQALGVKHVPVPSLTRAWGPGNDLRAARELWRTLRGLQLDVLHTHNPKTGILGRVLGRLVGIPIVVNTCHGLWASPEDRRLKRLAVEAVEAFASRFSHAELFQNATDRERLRWAIPDSRAEVVGNGVDLDRFRFDANGRARVRAELGVADHELLVGAVGRRVAEKGIGELAIAAAALAERARFVWIGPSDDAKPDHVVGDLGSLCLVEERTDMPAVYSALDVFVLPSHREGFSRSAMEAAACGRPMILTDIRGCREIGDDGRELLLVPPRDPEVLRLALARMLLEPDLRSRLGDAAAVRARAAFDQQKVAQRSLDTYRRVAAQRGLW